MATNPQLKSAAQLIDAGRYDEAKQTLTAIIRADSQNADAWYLASTLMDDKSRQIQALERVLSINPFHLDAQQALARLKANTKSGAFSADIEAVNRPKRSTSSQPKVLPFLEEELHQFADVMPDFMADVMPQAPYVEPQNDTPAQDTGYSAWEAEEAPVTHVKPKKAPEPPRAFPVMEEQPPVKPEPVKKHVAPAAAVHHGDYVEDGLHAIDKGSFTLAIKAFTKAIEVNPDDPDAHVYRGQVYEMLHQIPDALADYKQALTIYPKHPEAARMRDFIDHVSKPGWPEYYEGLSAFEEEDYVRALSRLSRAIQLNAKEPRFYLLRGRTHQEKGRLSDALSDFDQVVKLNSKEADAYLYRGKARILKDDVKGGINDFTTAIKLDPENFSAYLERGKAQFTKNDFKAAVADLSKSIELNGDIAEAYGFRGLARLQLKDKAAAQADYQAAIAIEPAQRQAMELIIKLGKTR